MMLKRIVGVVVAITALGTGAGATQAAPPAEPGAPADQTMLTDAQIYGSGPSGTGSEIPDCPAGSYLGWQDWICYPAITAVPAGTRVLATNGTCSATGDFETAFTAADQMDSMLECVLPVAVAWLDWEYSGLTPPPEWAAASASLLPHNFVYVPAGIAGETDQDCGYDEWSLSYCPLDGNVYLGESQLWSDFVNHGDADIWGTISHEMGHRVQHVAGMRAQMTDNENIPTENQADCFSGAFMAYAARHRYMDPAGPDTVSSDDVEDLIVGLLDIGESEGPDRTHGTDDQRVRALYIGYNAPSNLGVFACDFYLSDISIVPVSFGS
jgi:hypothetical protein